MAALAPIAFAGSAFGQENEKEFVPSKTKQAALESAVRSLPEWRAKALRRDDAFLASLGDLQGEPTIQAPQRPGDPQAKAPKQWVNALGMRFVWIAPGEFQMGSPREEESRYEEETQHKVKLTKGFHMGVHTVTQEQWQKVMGFNPSHFQGEKNLPVEAVTWNECQQFCLRLRALDKKPYRLPTEAEWEYCCRAGTKTPFSFGATISSDQANYNASEAYGPGKVGVFRRKTMPVGSFPPNAFGLFDMHGNVRQWCQDRFGEYPNKDVVDPQGPDAGAKRVIRGAGWNFLPLWCRSAHRHSSLEGTNSWDIGLRVCFTPE